jgi:hypothetical protein
MLKSYGRIASESYDREEGDVRALIANLTGDYAHDVDNLGIGMWVQYLQLALTNFENLLLQREGEQLAKPPYTARQARRRLEKVYYMMKSTVEVSAATASAEVVGAFTAFTAFIDKLNADIERLNTEFHRAAKDLGAGDHTVIEPIPTQPYTEQPVTPVPTVYYREDETKPVEKLWLGKDFEVTYKNNVKVGMAELTIHGKGKYKGTVTVKFNIARAK